MVLVALRAAGLCGSDLHMHYRPAPEARRSLVFGLRTDPDVVPGHEIAGVVAALGPHSEPLHLGDRVAVHHIAGCGHCMACRRGWDINCALKWGIYGLDRPGGMQDFVTVRARDCALIPENVSFAEAAYYSCGGATGYLALQRGRLAIGEVVAVVGLGPVGLAAAHFGRFAGATILAVDPVPARRRLAVQIGLSADAAADPSDARETVSSLTGGTFADLVIEASGTAEGRRLALGLARVGGRVVCVGFGDARNVIDLQATVIQKQLDLLGAWMFPLPDLQEMLQNVGRLGWSSEALITGRFSLEDGQQAWAHFDQGASGKTVITWPESTAPGI